MSNVSVSTDGAHESAVKTKEETKLLTHPVFYTSGLFMVWTQFWQLILVPDFAYIGMTLTQWWSAAGQVVFPGSESFESLKRSATW